MFNQEFQWISQFWNQPTVSLLPQRGVPHTEANGLRNPDALSPSTRATWRFFKWQDFPTHGEMVEPYGKETWKKIWKKNKNLMLNKKNIKHPTTTSQSKWIAHNSAPMNFCDSWPSQCNPPCHDTWLTQRVVPCRSFAPFGNRKISRNEKQRGGPYLTNHGLIYT